MKRNLLLLVSIIFYLSKTTYAQTDVSDVPRTAVPPIERAKELLPYDLPIKNSIQLPQTPILEKQVIALSPTETGNTCTFKGQITNTDVSMTNRLNRDATSLYCGRNKAFPGLFSSIGTFYYDTYPISNTSGVSKCAIFSLSAGTVAGEVVHLSVYNGSFNPANQALNYLGDLGSSSLGGAGLNDVYMSLNVPNNSNLILVVFSPTSNTFTTGNYTLSITNLACASPPTCSLTGTISASSSMSSGRIFRDANASVCGSYKAFPGISGAGISYNYVTHSIDNYTGSSRCVTFTFSGGVNELYFSVYNGKFDPTNLSQNYIGDIGSSPAGASVSCNLTIPDNSTLTLVINAVNTLAAPVNYGIEISNLPCKPKCTFSGLISNTDASMSNRITRDGNIQNCGVAKPFPGMFSLSGVYYYDTYKVSNYSGVSRCGTFSITAGISTASENVHLSVYNGSFDPNNQSANYMGDVGSSSAGASPLTQSTNISIPNNTDLILVVFTTTDATITQNSYTLDVSGLVCCPVVLAPINPDNNIVSGVANFKTNTITGVITANNKVSSSSTVIMEAGKFIQLNPGFEVSNGAIFKAQKGGCQ